MHVSLFRFQYAKRQISKQFAARLDGQRNSIESRQALYHGIASIAAFHFSFGFQSRVITSARGGLVKRSLAEPSSKLSVLLASTVCFATLEVGKAQGQSEEAGLLRFKTILPCTRHHSPARPQTCIASLCKRTCLLCSSTNTATTRLSLVAPTKHFQNCTASWHVLSVHCPSANKDN